MKFKVVKNFRFYFLLFTFLFHFFLLIITAIDGRYLLSALLLIPVGLFGYKLIVLLRQ